MGRSVILKAILLFFAFSLFSSLLIVNAQSSGWNSMQSPTTNALLSVFMVGSNDGWAVGTDGTIIRWNGQNWNIVPSSTTALWLNSVFMVNPTDGWVVGSGGTILRWDGTSWNSLTSLSLHDLTSVFMVSSTDGWAVGYSGVIRRWNGQNWNSFPSPISSGWLNSVFMVGSTDGWAVGTDGTIIRWNGQNWSLFSSPITGRSLLSVSMVSSTDGWAVGEKGTIIRWNGQNWSLFSSPITGESLHSVFMVTSNNGWAVGSGGTILRWDGTSWNSLTSPSTSFLYSVYVSSPTDIWTVGNNGNIYRWSGETPHVAFTISPTPNIVDEIITFDASGSSDSDGTLVDYAWDFGDGATGTGMEITHSYTSAGNYTITLTVTDNDGQIASTTKTVIVNSVDEKLPPSASFTFSPHTQVVNEPIDFDASESSDPDGIIDNYSWDFGDGTTGIGETVTHSYPEVGNFGVTLTVTDNDELKGTVKKEVVITPPGQEDVEPPVANAGNNMKAKAGSKVSFSAAGSSDNVGIISYVWDFGDGVTGSGETISHIYDEVGTYTVSLRVMDAAGNFNTVTIVITVEEAAASAFPYWILIPIILGIVVVVAIFWFFLKKRKPKEKVPKPARIKVTVDPAEVLADGKSTSTITIELLDEENKPVQALSDTEVKLFSSMGKVKRPIVKIPRGKESEKTVLVASNEAGTVTLSADAKELERAVITVTFKEKKRYCMHCGAKMPLTSKQCPECGKSPPSGVDTKTCKNCNAVIPIVAKFCPECGASQPKEE